MIDPNTIDLDFQFDGLLEGFPSEDEMLRSEVAKPFPREWLIDKSEWRDRIEEHKKYKTFAEDYSGRTVHQGSSHECVSMSATLCFETTYNRQMSGLGHQVWFSPLSLYTRVTGGRRYGGSSVIGTMWEMLSGDGGGMIPEHDGPEGKNSQYEKFKHTVHQTSGRSEPWWPTKGWINPRELPSGWESIAEHFQVLECFTIPSAEAHISCLLGSPSCAISNGRSGHSISHQSVVYDNGRFYSRYQDSYGDRYGHDSLRMLGGGYCIRAVTMPHDPKNPAESMD